MTTATTTPKCSVCSGPPHAEPAEVAYGLTCPGETAQAEAQRAYRIALRNARIIESRHTTTFASDPILVAEIIARQDAAAARFAARPLRSAQSTHEELAADCAARTPTVVAMVDTNAALAPEQFEPPEHLRVPATPRERHKIRRIADAYPAGNLSDYALFLGSEGVGS